MTDALLRQLLDNSVDLCTVLDRSGSIIFVNRALETRLGLPQAEIIGRPFCSMVHSDDVKSVRTLLERAFDSLDIPRRITFRIAPPDQESRILEASYWAVKDPDTGFRLLLSAHDATVRVEAQQQLKDREDQLERAQRIASLGSWELNLTNNELTASHQLYRLYGIEPRSSISFNELKKQFHPEDQESIDTTLRHAQQTMGSFRLQHRIIRTDGEERIIHVRGETELYGSDFIMYGTAQDVTDQIETENALRKSEARYRTLTAMLHKAEEEERARLAREVHDVLGQTTTALRLDTLWLKENGPQGDDAFQNRAQQAIELIEETIGIVRRISHDLRPAVLDHFGLVAAIEWMSERFEDRADIAFEVIDETNDRLDGMGADLATALFRIFQEAVTNIIRHAEASSVHVRVTCLEGVLTLEIKDDGKGLRQEDALHSSSLGLLNMKERALPWHGEVAIEGAPDEGTCVLVTIPYDC